MRPQPTSKELLLTALGEAYDRRLITSGPVAWEPRFFNTFDSLAAIATLMRDVQHDVYDEFRSQLPFPKAELATQLEAAGLGELAKRVEDGIYDATAQEARDYWDTEGKKRFEEMEREMPSDTWAERIFPEVGAKNATGKKEER